MSHIVYTTDWADQTVTIDYNETFRQFLTKKESYPFSAEKIMEMLNRCAKGNSVSVTFRGEIHIVVGEVHCVLTQKALNILSLLSRQHSDWQVEYPFVFYLLA